MKPGNVHIFADGHGMVVQDFIKSAEASALPISKPEYSVGQRIYHAVEATLAQTSCNTNLGIVLLCAPIIQSYLDNSQIFTLESLKQTLADLTSEDAVWTYRAIKLASPAGLGQVQQHDVNEVPHVTLLQAMQSAALRDNIAKQYAHGYEDVVLHGVQHYEHISKHWEREAWVITAVYLRFLSRMTDSHILRKWGESTALAVQQEAAAIEEVFVHLENPKHYMPQLLAFDQSLKARGINPGTSADLTVATILLTSLLK